MEKVRERDRGRDQHFKWRGKLDRKTTKSSFNVWSGRKIPYTPVFPLPLPSPPSHSQCHLDLKKKEGGVATWDAKLSHYGWKLLPPPSCLSVH